MLFDLLKVSKDEEGYPRRYVNNVVALGRLQLYVDRERFSCLRIAITA